MEIVCGMYGTFITDQEVDFTNDHCGNYVICANDNLVRVTDMVRFKNHCYDLVSESRVNKIKQSLFSRGITIPELNADNDVYYTFYLMFDLDKDETSLEAQCCNGKEDDFVFYKLPMYKEEKEGVKSWLIKQLARDLYNI